MFSLDEVINGFLIFVIELEIPNEIADTSLTVAICRQPRQPAITGAVVLSI